MVDGMRCPGVWLLARSRRLAVGLSMGWWSRAVGDGDRSASCADFGRVDRHGHRRGVALSGRAGRPRRGPGFLAQSRARISRSRWRRRPAGGLSSRSSTASARRRTLPSRRRRVAEGQKRRAKTDWADARHLRELLLIGRLPESWIPPRTCWTLRARVRCRHTLVEQRTQWQRRMHAGPLSPRCPAVAQAARAQYPRVGRRPEAPGGGARATHDRAGALRRDRHSARSRRRRAARLRPQAARLPDTDRCDLRKSGS